MTVADLEVAVIGGGPAGLSAALTLARAGRRVLVLDAGKPRNAASPGVQGFLSRDGLLPTLLRREAREQIEAYGTVRFADDRVVDIARHGDRFRLLGAAGERHQAHLAILAVGMVDRYPDIEGFEALWGSRIIHCAFCHGWENRGRRWGLLAGSLQEVAQAQRFLLWSDELCVFLPPGLAVPQHVRAGLASRNISLESRRVVRVVAADESDLAGVELEDGDFVACGTLVYQPQQHQSSLVAHLGLRLDSDQRIAVSCDGETSLPGLYAAGDITPGGQNVSLAAAEGNQLGMAVAHQLAAMG